MIECTTGGRRGHNFAWKGGKKTWYTTFMVTLFATRYTPTRVRNPHILQRLMQGDLKKKLGTP